MNSNKRRGENYADTIVSLFSGSDSLNVEIDPSFSEHAIEALQDRGCVVLHERESARVTIYLQGNRQHPLAAAALRLTYLH